MTVPAELVIEVTADDIRLGKPNNVCQCAVALAALRALGEFDGILKVEEDAPATLQISLYASDDMGNPSAAYMLPTEAVTFIARFDGLLVGDVAPFTFTVALAATS